MPTTVSVTQFTRPYRRAVEYVCELPYALEAEFRAMEQSGCRFEAEVLTTGEVSITITNEEEDVDIRIIPKSRNAPGDKTVAISMAYMLVYNFGNREISHV